MQKRLPATYEVLRVQSAKDLRLAPQESEGQSLCETNKMSLSQYQWKLDGIRPMFYYLSQRRKPQIGVELGVWKGLNAEKILEIFPMLRTLYLVDNYPKYKDGNNHIGKLFDYSASKPEMLSHIAKYGERTIFIELNTIEAAIQIPNELDFVYIDANHCYENVKIEIATYYPKVKNGGVIGGHDINFYGVMRAVGEFAESLDLHPLTDDVDWWIWK